MAAHARFVGAKTQTMLRPIGMTVSDSLSAGVPTLVVAEPTQASAVDER